MDYEKRKKSGSERMLRKWWILLIAVILLSAVITYLLDRLFPFSIPENYSTVILDREGNLMNAYLSSDDKWRMKTELEEISPLLRETIIHKEDKHFYYHPGIDIFAISRAFVKNIIRFKRTSGASTITMQVARLLEPKPRTYWNKCIEAFRAVQLEWHYSKDEILQAYINRLPFSGNIEGIKSAAWIYFQKSPNHLSLAEITTLTIIPNRPSSLVLGKKNDEIIQARNQWLRKFAEEKVFDHEIIQLALEEPLLAYRSALPRQAPHFSYQLKKRNTFNIQSTLYQPFQYNIEQMVSDYVRSMRLQGIEQAAVVVIDNSTREILAYTGSADFSEDRFSGQVDGAKAIRQPGSTLKPFVYAMAIDEGMATPRSIITDVAVNYQGYTPENFDKKLNGFVSLEYALGNSLNIPAVKTLHQVGKAPFLEMLKEAGFRQIARDEKKLGLSVILGGCGTNLLELTNLYSTLANGGMYHPLKYTVTDTLGSASRLWSNAASFMIHEVLTKIQRPDFPLHWQATDKLPQIAWKTGTSYGRRDAWSIGYNQKYTVGVWLGNFDGSGVHGLQGAITATPLLFRIFNQIDYNSELGWFEMPEDCDIRLVCAETGKLPTDQCTQIVNDYYIPFRSSNAYCDAYEWVYLNTHETLSYCVHCMPAAGYRKKWMRRLSAEMQQYFTSTGIPFEKIPPHNPQCEIISKHSGPLITSLQAGEEYLLSRNNPEPLQLKAEVANDVYQIYWYINDEYFKAALPGERLYFQPLEGMNKITCVDDRGRSKTIWIRVTQVSI